jgi:iron complex outermembrane recepter protein
MRTRRFTRALVTSTAVVGALLMVQPEAVDAQGLAKELVPQLLADALDKFASDTGLQLVYHSQIAAGLQSKGARAGLSAEETLRELLRGTGLTFEFINERTIAIRASDDKRNDAADAADIELEEIVVVGTLLRNTLPTSPVISLNREDMERGGYVSVEDVVARMPQNFSGVNVGTPLVTGGNVGMTTQVDLRGLGSEASLTLVNGRRISSAAGDDGRAVDISMIPLAAVERIDILTDGASALYGSDAIGGVVNIVLSKDFNGAETTLHYGDGSGGDELGVTQMLGTSWGSGRILATAQYTKNESLTFRDIGIRSLDFRGRGGGDHRVDFFASPGTVLPAGFYDGQPFTTLTDAAGQPVFFAALPPGSGRSLDVAQLRLNDLNYADNIFLEDILPEQESAAAYLTLEQGIGSITLFADGAFSRRTALFVQGDTTGFLYVPTSNAFSPFAEDVLVAYRYADFGPIVYDTEKSGWFVNLGARGSWGVTDWTWEIVGTQSRDESENVFDFPDRDVVAERLASSDPTFAFNPFGDGSGQAPGVMDAIRRQAIYDGRTTLRGASAQTQGSLRQLPGGVIRLALGSEYREEEMEGGVLREGWPEEEYYPGAARDVAALFGELYVPFVGRANARRGVQELALSAAARYESYSDFGDTVNPKLGLLWRPTESLSLKANWGTSFRAPSLRELAFTSHTASNIEVFDPRAPGGPAHVFVELTEGGNPDLKEETARTYTVSGEYQPTWLDGARLSLTYYHIDYDDRIRGSLDGLDEELLLQFEDSLPPGIVVRAPDGTLQSIKVININSAATVMSGYDAAAGYFWSTQHWGSFDLSVGATYTAKYEDQVISGAPVLSLAGRVGSTPDWRGRVSLVWSSGPWNAAISVHHTDALRNEDLDPRIVRRDIDSQTTADVQVGLTAADDAWLRGFSVRFGVTNLFDDRPPFVESRRGIDVQNSVIAGRAFYLRLSQAFGAAAAR